MNDPAPEKIQGLKKATHSVEVKINVSHLLLFIAVLYLLMNFGKGEDLGTPSKKDDLLGDVIDGGGTSR